MFNNWLDDLVNSFNKKDVISRHQNRNARSSQLLAEERDKVVGHSEPKKRINNAKRNTSDISFLY